LDNTAAAAVYANIDLQAGVFSVPMTAVGGATAGIASITPVGNGVYRCVISGNIGAATTMRVLFGPAVPDVMSKFGSYTGDTSKGLLIWGAQLEQGAFPTSYIPTTSAAVTRAIDVASMPTNVSWYNASAMTMMGEALFPVSTPSNSAAQAIFGFNDNTFNNRLEISRDANANTMQGVELIGGTAVAYGVIGSLVVGGITRAAIASSSGSQRSALNGGPVFVSGTGVGMPVINNLSIGSIPLNTYILNGYIRRLVYWNRALSDTELQQVTT
jgi:hypothetical protein